jgi:hypothetical protein
VKYRDWGKRYRAGSGMRLMGKQYKDWGVQYGLGVPCAGWGQRYSVGSAVQVLGKAVNRWEWHARARECSTELGVQYRGEGVFNL